jgi:hypothetical protein
MSCIISSKTTCDLHSLNIKDHLFELGDCYQKCCSGLGIQFADVARTAINRCNVAQKLRTLNYIAASFYRHRGSDVELQDIVQFRNKKGERMVFECCDDRQLLFSEGPKAQTKAWQMWMRWAWDDLCGVHLISLSGPITQLNDAFRNMQKFERNLLVIHEIDKLWDRENRDFFEAIIDFCESYQLRIWLDIVSPKFKEPSPTKKKTTFSRKYRDLQQKPLMEYIDNRSLSKLSAMSGFSPFEEQYLKPKANDIVKNKIQKREIY